MIKTVQFREWTCHVILDRYQNGRIALSLVDANNGEPVATATCNIPELPLEDHEVFIKDYSENEGMLATLEKAGIVRNTGQYVTSGFVKIPVCELLIDPTELL